MVSVMNLLHGDPHGSGRAGGPFSHHPHLPVSGPGPQSTPASHQRSPFAIQELLGLGNNDNNSSTTARSPPPNSPHVSTATAAVSMGHPYHPRAPQQGFPDPSRMYFGAGFMPGAMHGMPAPPHMPMLGFDQPGQALSHPRSDGNGE